MPRKRLSFLASLLGALAASRTVLAAPQASDATTPPGDPGGAAAYQCAPPDPDVAASRGPAEAPFRLGVAVGIDTGLAGHLASAGSVISVGPEFSLPIGRFRWHFLVAFDTVDTPGAYSGVRVEALDFGLPIALPLALPRRARLEIEPVFLNAVEILANDGHELLWSSVFGAQANLLMGDLYCSALPAGVELREASLQGDSASTSGSIGFGFNLQSRASCGLRF
jgi:hypothetical protein